MRDPAALWPRDPPHAPNRPRPGPSSAAGLAASLGFVREDSPVWAALIAYLVVANLVSFTLFGLDKSRARAERRRIRERTLLVSALVSGSVGAWLGMSAFRHKTAKRSFQVRMVLVTVIDAVLAAVVALLALR